MSLALLKMAHSFPVDDHATVALLAVMMTQLRSLEHQQAAAETVAVEVAWLWRLHRNLRRAKVFFCDRTAVSASSWSVVVVV